MVDPWKAVNNPVLVTEKQKFEMAFKILAENMNPKESYSAQVERSFDRVEKFVELYVERYLV